MTVDHLVLRGTNPEIGQAVAEEARRAFSWQPVAAADITRNRARRRWFERHWPPHYDRMCGVAMACDLEVDDDRYDFGTLLAIPVAPGCSAVWCSGRAAEDGRAVVSRNMDFTTRTLSEFLGGEPLPGEPAMMSRPAVLEIHPDQGPATLVTAIGDRLCVTNYLLHRTGVDSVPVDKEREAGIGDAYRRARVLHDGLGDSPIGPRQLWDLVEAVRADERRDQLDPVTRNRTLWHNQFDLEGRSVEYEFYLGDAQGGPRRSPAITVAL